MQRSSHHGARAMASIGLAAILFAAAAPAAHAAPAAPPARPVVVHFPVDSLDVEFVPDFGVFAKGRIHHGIDILAERGTPVVAIADGFVTRVWTGRRAGFALTLRHAGGWESRYLHLDNDTPGSDDGAGGAATAYADGIAEGVFVPAGTVIGYLGDSGNAEETPPHLHFELRRDGRRHDPYPRLVLAIERARHIALLAEAGVPLK